MKLRMLSEGVPIVVKEAPMNSLRKLVADWVLKEAALLACEYERNRHELSNDYGICAADLADITPAWERLETASTALLALLEADCVIHDDDLDELRAALKEIQK